MANILVVEDEPELRRLVVRELEAAGYQVRYVADGPAAVQQLAAAPPDLVVLDWMLPGLAGLEVLRRLRQTSAVPVLMLTARGQGGAGRRGRQHRAVWHARARRARAGAGAVARPLGGGARGQSRRREGCA